MVEEIADLVCQDETARTVEGAHPLHLLQLAREMGTKGFGPPASGRAGRKLGGPALAARTREGAPGAAGDTGPAGPDHGLRHMVRPRGQVREVGIGRGDHLRLVAIWKDVEPVARNL